MKLFPSLLSCIGNTCLIRLRYPDEAGFAQVWCKLEFLNPGGSPKDRICLAIVNSLESSAGLCKGDALIEASCGNTAISLGMIAAYRGYRLILVMPEGVSVRRRRLLSSFGAQIVLTPGPEGMKGATAKAADLAESMDRAFPINQFDNPENPEVHRRTTAVEILKSLGKVPDCFVAGVGTGGTITGVGEFLKKKNPSVRVVAVEPADSPVLSGGKPGPSSIPGIGPGFIPRILNLNILDDIAVVTREEAQNTIGLLAAEEGILAGLSSGAVVHSALKEAERLGPGKVVVTVLGDSAERAFTLGSREP
jgi:cysteine synthase